MSAGVGYAAWLSELEAAFDEVARSALGADAVAVSRRHAAPGPSLQGAYLGMVGPTGAIQIGLAADEEGCQALSRRLLGMADGDPALSPEEMADAVCEIVNIVAGGFKARLRDRAALQIGLPTFFRGPAQPSGHTAVAVADVTVQGCAAALLLVHPREEGE